MARGGNKASETPDEPAVGDGGAREEEVSQAQQTFDAMHEHIELGDEAGLVVRNATDWVIELFKHRPKPWDQLSQSEQRDLVAGIEHNVHELVRHVVEAIARTGRESVRCLFVGFTDKGDDIKAELKVKAMSKDETESAVLSFHRARGKHVLVTVASADDFHDAKNVDRSEPDQPALGFDAGSDEVVDLETAATDPNELHDGDRTDFAGEPGKVRVNLSSGWVQFLADNEASEDAPVWQDMREATAAELAAERERTADFGAEEEAEETVEA